MGVQYVAGTDHERSTGQEQILKDEGFHIMFLFRKKQQAILHGVRNMNVVSVVKVGRLTCGAQKGHGVVRHALDANKYCFGTKSKSLCGTEPGRRSVGFVSDEGNMIVTCERCKKKIEKQGHTVVDVSATGRY